MVYILRTVNCSYKNLVKGKHVIIMVLLCVVPLTTQLESRLLELRYSGWSSSAVRSFGDPQQLRTGLPLACQQGSSLRLTLLSESRKQLSKCDLLKTYQHRFPKPQGPRGITKLSDILQRVLACCSTYIYITLCALLAQVRKSIKRNGGWTDPDP